MGSTNAELSRRATVDDKEAHTHESVKTWGRYNLIRGLHVVGLCRVGNVDVCIIIGYCYVRTFYAEILMLYFSAAFFRASVSSSLLWSGTMVPSNFPPASAISDSRPSPLE